jgi:hypothetical protein
MDMKQIHKLENLYLNTPNKNKQTHQNIPSNILDGNRGVLNV